MRSREAIDILETIMKDAFNPILPAAAHRLAVEHAPERATRPEAGVSVGSVLVVGATGTIGASLVPGLLAAGHRVRAASRTGRPVAGAESVRLDLAQPDTYPHALEGVDRIFLVNPSENLDVAGALHPMIEQAARRSIRVVLLSQHRADRDPSNPYAVAERHMRTVGARGVVLRPNWFSDNFHTFWAEGVASGVLSLPAAGGRISFVDSRDIADAAVAALGTDRFDGQAFELTGPQALDLHQAVALLSSVTGRAIRYEPVTPQRYIAVLAQGGVPETYARMLAGLFDLVRAGDTAEVADGVRRLTGLAPRSLARYARERWGEAAGAGVAVGLPDDEHRA